jgi:hypothetical protein
MSHDQNYVYKSCVSQNFIICKMDVEMNTPPPSPQQLSCPPAPKRRRTLKRISKDLSMAKLIEAMAALTITPSSSARKRVLVDDESWSPPKKMACAGEPQNLFN